MRFLGKQVCAPLLSALLLAGGLSVANAQTGGPAQPAPPEGHKPPPQAFEACKGKQEGDQVQVTLPDGQKLSASCVNSPQGLFARPPHPPHPPAMPEPPEHPMPGAAHQGPGWHEPPPQAYELCKGKKEGDVVSIQPPGGHALAATCVASDKGLFARPEHPPHEGPPPMPPLPPAPASPPAQ